MLSRLLLTYKQHRFELICTLLVCVGFSAAALWVAWQLNGIVFPKGCSPDLYTGGPSFDANGQPIFQEPSRACQVVIDHFNSIRNGTLAGLIKTGLILAPFPLAILLGAPVVAREIEQNTAPLSWALAGSRRRWLLARLASLVLVLIPAMLLLGVGADVLYGASNPGTSPWASFGEYELRGVPIVFWALAAFLGTVALGTIFGRVLPAIFVALIVCLFARVGGEYFFQRVMLPPYAHQLMTWDQLTSGNGYGWNPVDLTVGYTWYLDGKPFTGDANEWYNTHQPPGAIIDGNGTAIGIAVPAPTPAPSGAPSNPVVQGPWGPTSLPVGFHGNQYWPVVAAECGILLAGGLLCGAIGLYWVGRRRPY